MVINLGSRQRPRLKSVGCCVSRKRITKSNPLKFGYFKVVVFVGLLCILYSFVHIFVAVFLYF